MDFSTIKYDDLGLVPAIVQDEDTGEVLMMAYMNKESLKKTIETKRTWFYSRSRQSLWNKGETSGNVQDVKSISYDCDGDTLLVKVHPHGPSCHTGNYSCFFNDLVNEEDKSNPTILNKLYETIKDRRDNPIDGSYTNYLFDKGIDKILKKVGEENAETIIAAKNNSKEELIYEASDLVYHLMVLFVHQNVSLEDIYRELEKRYK